MPPPPRQQPKGSAERRAGGFTLVELIVVVAVMALLVGTAAPLFVRLHDYRRDGDVRAELEKVAEALDAYYYDKGSFPPTLRSSGFYGMYLSPGVQDSTIKDSWGGDVEYVYSVSANPDVATIRSRGPDGSDDSGTGDDLVQTVHGSSPGYRKTRERMRLIVEVLANFLESGGSLTGTWSVDRNNMGLGAAYENDGFGTLFQLDPSNLILRSAGPDRSFGSSDDLTT